uniref:Purinergic receptor P2X 1 n=1 Tax=Equus asinus asinus TaxID=83772 RepID=A0A8C4M1D8_EQUAS
MLSLSACPTPKAQSPSVPPLPCQLTRAMEQLSMRPECVLGGHWGRRLPAKVTPKGSETLPHTLPRALGAGGALLRIPPKRPGASSSPLPQHPEGGTCADDSGCIPGKAERKAQGIRTGKCVAFNDTVQTCEIFGWCPVEVDDDIPRPALLREAENFTLFIKNSISFPRFKVKRRNLVEVVDAAYMKTCLYHKTLHPLCPVFKLGYVIQESGQNFSTLAEKGGVVGITIDWNCDLDWHVRHCKPIYEFHGLYEEKNLSPGFNFRCLPGPTSAPFLGGPQALPLPEPLEAKQVSLGGEQRSPGSSQSPGIGQAGSLRGTRPWRPEPLLLALGPLEAHLARTRWGNC